jgi:CO/xanthine dehydrogenase Mo-binding subunit
VISGNAIIDACNKIKGRLTEAARGLLASDAVYDSAAGGASSPGNDRTAGFLELVAACFDRRIGLAATGWYAVPECSVDAATGQGKAYYVYSFATDIAEVEVDTGTGEVKVKSLTAVHDSGRIVNRLTATGQVEGGIAQGLGFAVCETFAHEGGRIMTGDLSTYLIPTSLDVCDDLRVEFIECLSSDGPFGAKGLGEPAIIPVPAAVANAVSNALGRRVTALPIDREFITNPGDPARGRKSA